MIDGKLAVVSVGNNLCAPSAVCSVRMDQGVHEMILFDKTF